MSERLETLKKARERMIDDRDAFAKVLAAPFDRDKAERARMKFIETQALIDAIDRAIAGEQNRPGPVAWLSPLFGNRTRPNAVRTSRKEGGCHADSGDRLRHSIGTFLDRRL